MTRYLRSKPITILKRGPLLTCSAGVPDAKPLIEVASLHEERQHGSSRVLPS